MPDFIKLDSDRPDYDRTLVDQDGADVDLTDASSVYILMWSSNGDTLLINDTATIEAPPLGHISYDFDRGQIVEAGTNLIEIRVEWDNGDRQWFPEDSLGYELEVVRSAGDREADLEEPAAETDATVNRLTLHDDIDIQDDDGTLDIVNGDVAIPDGDLTVGGDITFGSFNFGDDDPLVYGADLDVHTLFASADDAYKIRNNLADIDLLSVTKGGNVRAPNGWISGELLDATAAGSEQNLRFGSADSGIASHAYVRALIDHGDVSGGPWVAFDDSDAGTGAARINTDTGEAVFEGAVTVLGDAVVTEGGTAGTLAHADLGGVGADDHHARYTDAEALSYVQAQLEHSDMTFVNSNDHHTRFSDEEAVDAVAAALVDQHFVYDDANDEILFNVGNVAHDDHSGINGTNHHGALIAQDSGTQVSEGVYTLDFASGLAVTESGGVVTVENTGGSGGDYTDGDAIDAINTDTDHGSTAQHDYFGGAHGDLSGVSADDHHEVFEPADYTPEADTHDKTQPGDIDSSNWGDVEIFVEESEPAGWSDGDLWFEPST